MLPLVLGGIALAAVGYGVKEYCESEGCPWDDEPQRETSTPVNVFEALHKQKVELFESKLVKFKKLLLKIEHETKKSDFEDETYIYEEKLAAHELEDDVKLYATSYKNVLHTSAHLVERYVATLELVLSKQIPYKNLATAEKKFIKKSYKLTHTIQRLVSIRLLDKKVLNISAIALLKKLKAKLEDFETGYKIYNARSI